MDKITTFLWYDTEAEEAAKFYCSVFPNSRITQVTHYTEAGPAPAGSVMTVAFELDGRSFAALNGGPHCKFTEAISLVVNCADQAEVDYYWNALSAGGREVQCGWLNDRWGLRWQIVPTAMFELLGDPDRARTQRAMQAMFKMVKLDIAALKAAAEG